MRTSCFLSLMTCCLLAACADSSGSVFGITDGPQPPVNEPDTGVFSPGEPTEPATNNPSGGSEPPGNNGNPGSQGGGSGVASVRLVLTGPDCT
jgi:hypothetical protein